MASSQDLQQFPLLPRLIATTAGCGYWPWGPGTMGAIGGVAVWLLALIFIHSAMTMWCTIAALIIVFTFAGAWAGSISEKYWGPDPSRVVIDETVGQWLAMLPLSGFAAAGDPWHEWSMWCGVTLSLVAFRFFDIVKPLGVRSMERFPGGWGIMADDILAGIYSAMVVIIYIMAL